MDEPTTLTAPWPPPPRSPSRATIAAVVVLAVLQLLVPLAAAWAAIAASGPSASRRRPHDEACAASRPPAEHPDTVAVPDHLRAMQRAPGSPDSVITPHAAARLFRASWAVRDAANVAHDLVALREVETGSALLYDTATIRTGCPPERGPGERPVRTTVYVPRQEAFPARFMAQAVTTIGGQRGLQLFVFSRRDRDSPWRIVLTTSWIPPRTLRDSTQDPTLDADGYDVVPSNPPIDVATADEMLAGYYRTWKEQGHAPPLWPTLLDGPWAAAWGRHWAEHPQDTPNKHGVWSHVTFSPAAPDNTYAFGVWGVATIVCTSVRIDLTYRDPHGGVLYQDDRRQNWGTLLAPGDYPVIHEQREQQSCVMTDGTVPRYAVLGGDGGTFGAVVEPAGTAQPASSTFVTEGTVSFGDTL